MPDIKIATALIQAITEGTYHDSASQIREMVANAIDAGADTFNIVSLNDSIAFIDNGKGLDEATFENDYLSLGHSKAKKDIKKIGNFGIGMLSITPICEEIYIYSQNTSNKPLQAKIKTAELFDENNSDKDLTEIFNVIYEENSDETFLRIKNLSDKLFNQQTTYTCIYLKKVKKEMSNYVLQSINFEVDLKRLIDNLRIILPLTIADQDKFLDFIEKNNSIKEKQTLLKIYNNSTYVNVVLNWYRFDENELLPELISYKENISHSFYGNEDFNKFPIEDIKIFDWEIIDVDEKLKIQFGGYIILNTKVIGKDWRKIKIRLNNTFVCNLDDADIEGDLHQVYPKEQYISGELFVIGLKKALKITRDSFDTNTDDFISFFGSIKQKLEPLLKLTNKKYKIKKDSNNFFVKEQNELPRIIEKSLNRIVSIWNENDKNEIISKLKLNKKIPVLKDKPNLDEYLNEKLGERILISKCERIEGSSMEEEDGCIYLKPIKDIEEPVVRFIESDKKETNDIEIQISPNFFKNKNVNVKILGDVEIITKFGNENDPSFEIVNDEKTKVYINFFNKEIRNYDISVFEVEIILYTAYSDTPDNKSKFFEEALKRLRGTYAERKKQTNTIEQFINFKG